MKSFICKRGIKTPTDRDVFIEGREYRAILQDDEYRFIDYHNAGEGLFLRLTREQVEIYFRSKDFIFGR